MKRRKSKLTQSQIDACVITQANDNSAWSRPVRVRRSILASLAAERDDRAAQRSDTRQTSDCPPILSE
jgi:hypothetical protein